MRFLIITIMVLSAPLLNKLCPRLKNSTPTSSWSVSFLSTFATSCENLVFITIKREFNPVLCKNNSALPAELLENPENWYICFGDGDAFLGL